MFGQVKTGAFTIETERFLGSVGVGVPTGVESAGMEEDFAPKAAGDIGFDAACNGELNDMRPKAQSINKLYQVSQLCPRTMEQLVSSRLTYKEIVWISLVGKRSGKSIDSEMTAFVVLSNNQSGIGGIREEQRLCGLTRLESRKQWVELESMRALIAVPEAESEEMRKVRESEERVDTLSLTSLVIWGVPMQPSAHTEVEGLLTMFLSLLLLHRTYPPWR
jgi:hypothetical protein